MKKMFVCTKPIVEPNGELQQHLLGILSQNEKGEYSFQYKLGPNDNGLLLPIFPDKDKIYSDHDTHLLLDDYLPSENDTSFMKEILKKSGMKEYDEWEWLRTFESIDENTSTRLYETLPDNVIIHVDLNDCSNEVETENNEESDFDDNEFEDEIPYFEDESSDEYGPEDFNESNETTDSNDFDLDEMFPFDEISIPNEANNAPNDVIIKDETDVLIDDVPQQQHVDLSKTENKTTTTVLIKKSTKRNQTDTADFIAPPPEDPSELIKLRLNRNIEQRQRALEEMKKSNTE